MRADRLLSILLLLQSHGKMPAKELAATLEVSERTIYRDIDSLSVAGIPVFGECGRAGGYDLLDSYKTSLTGLTEGELRALYMLNLPRPFDDLGIGKEYRQAMLKVTAALPDARRWIEEHMRQRIYLDSNWWDAERITAPHLQTIYRAVLQDMRLSLRIRLFFNIEIELWVDPLGLVIKAGVWYLVCASDAQLRVLRVSEIIDVHLSSQFFTRPADFELAGWWQEWCARRMQLRQAYAVTVRVAPAFYPYLALYTGENVVERVFQAGENDPQGWITLELRFESLEEARNRLLSCGGGVEVLSPQALRFSILDYARQTVALYSASV